MKETQWIAIKMAQMALGDGANPLVWVMSVRVVGLSNVALSGYASLDGVNTRGGDVVLLTSQTDPTQNGAWVVSANSWTRVGSDQQTLGFYFYVEEGVTKSNSLWRVTEALPNLTITQWSASASGVPTSRQIIAGNGLTGGGDLSADRTLNVAANADGSIVVGANDVGVGVLATDAQHGVRGGNNLHANASASVAGFMSSSDKSKLDGIPSSADPAGTASTSMSNHVADADPHPQYTTASEATAIAAATVASTKLDDLASPDDNTDLNATTLAHGLLRKLNNSTTQFLRGDGTWATPPASGGGNTGETEIDFGTFPGTTHASVTVTGQTGIVSGSIVRAWLEAKATSGAGGTNTSDEHVIASSLVDIIAGDIVDDTSFTIHAVCRDLGGSRLEPVGIGREAKAHATAANNTIKDPSVDSVGGSTLNMLWGRFTVAWSWS